MHDTSLIKVLEVETQACVDNQYMWFRLMQMNRYLSLTLGMLQGTPNNNFAETHILDACTPEERMQRMDCVVGGYILQRNEAGLYDTATTHMIDQLLQKSAACLPTSWWAVPELDPRHANEVETLASFIHVIDQIIHYHLITQLHLPHLTRPHTEHEYDYSKIVAANASREILTRYTSRNDAYSFKSWCRGISLVAFTACVAICIIHMRSRWERREQFSGTFLGVTDSEHQDGRGIMELALERMQSTARECNDPIASKTASILDQMLSVEADDGVCTQVDSLPSFEGHEHQIGCDSQVSECGRILYVNIASLGTLKFVRGKSPGSVTDIPLTSDLLGHNSLCNIGPTKAS